MSKKNKPETVKGLPVVPCQVRKSFNGKRRVIVLMILGRVVGTNDRLFELYHIGGNTAGTYETMRESAVKDFYPLAYLEDVQRTGDDI